MYMSGVCCYRLTIIIASVTQPCRLLVTCALSLWMCAHLSRVETEHGVSMKDLRIAAFVQLIQPEKTALE